MRVDIKLLAVVLYTLGQLRSSECGVGCRLAGYEGGYFKEEKACVCYDTKQYERFLEKRLIVRLPRKVWRPDYEEKEKPDPYKPSE